MKMSENLQLSDAFKGYRIGTLVVNELIQKQVTNYFFITRSKPHKIKL